MESTYNLFHGDLVIVQARKNAPFSGGSTPLGNLRLALHREAVSQALVPEPIGHEFRWVTDFPLFSPAEKGDEPGQGGKAGLRATHHPFTAPRSVEDIELLLSSSSHPNHEMSSERDSLLRIKGEHYDLVLNGIELGGGSRRIHSSTMQRHIFESILQMPPEKIKHFEHLLEVLRAGCPPHAGIALGFDRLVACMLEKESVRDVIAFPKSGKGEDVLVKSPGRLEKGDLETYGLEIKSS